MLLLGYAEADLAAGPAATMFSQAEEAVTLVTPAPPGPVTATPDIPRQPARQVHPDGTGNGAGNGNWQWRHLDPAHGPALR